MIVHEPFGFLAVDKPAGMTSHDVVMAVRRGTGVKRIGHAGTLDPMATGALILCVGAATRLSEYVMGQDKVYHATVRLGVETDTYDAEGHIVSTADASHVTQESLEAALSDFQGDIEQIPPMYSAIKVRGKKLYEMARQGEDIDRAPRRVHIFAMHLYEFEPPDVKLVIWCSSGTYIRSIAHDLGAALGTGAHLTALHRRVVGSLQGLIEWPELVSAMQADTWQDLMVSERLALRHIPQLDLDSDEVNDVLHGRFARQPATQPDDTLRRAYGPDGRFIAILEAQHGQWKPRKVFGDLAAHDS